MMSADTRTKPAARPYLAATAKFASGDDNPREFLERCLKALDAWEPQIGAFVNLNLPAARVAADLLYFRDHYAMRTLRPRAGAPASRSPRSTACRSASRT